MIKAILFDIDGVLIDSLEANFKFYEDLMSKFGFYGVAKWEEYPSLFHLPMKDAIRHYTQSKDEAEIEKIWLAGKKREIPYRHELINVCR